MQLDGVLYSDVRRARSHRLLYFFSRFEEVTILDNVEQLGDLHILVVAHSHYSFSVLITPALSPIAAK